MKNTLAYLRQMENLFFFVTREDENKLECQTLANFTTWSNIIRKAGAYPNALPAISRLDLSSFQAQNTLAYLAQP